MASSTIHDRDLAQRWLEESRTWAGHNREDRADALRAVDREQPDEELLAEPIELVAYVRGATFPHRDRLKRMGAHWEPAMKVWIFSIPSTASPIDRLQWVRSLRSLSGVRVTLERK